MTVSGVVMAHEKRRAWAEELAHTLNIDVVWDQINDRHETGLRCLQAGLDTDATHWLVVQDDAIVCGDLLAGIDAAVQVSGDRVVGLYVGNVRPQALESAGRLAVAKRQRRSWISMPGPWWGVGVVIPTVHLSALVDHYSKSREQNYDRRIEKWATAAKVECWYTVPSLVDHRHGVDNPSLVANRASLSRHARCFIGEDTSALDIDWTRTPAVETGWWRNRRGQVRKAAPGSPQARRYAEQGWELVAEARCGECGNRKFVATDDAEAMA